MAEVEQEDLLGKGEEVEVVRKAIKEKKRPAWRLNMPYWWRKYQLPTEIKDHHSFVPVKTSGKWPIRVLLDDAIRSGDISAAQKAVNAGADARHENKKGVAPVHSAIKHRQANVIKTLWDNGADMDATLQKTGDTALHLAAMKNEYTCIKSLMQVAASADILNCDGNAALHIAAQMGFYDSVSELLAGGADPLLKNTDGRTAKELAELNGHLDLAAYILNFE